MATATLTLTTTAGPDMSILKTEEFDVDFAQWIVNNKDISKDERDAVRKLLKDRRNGNKHETSYKLGKDIKHEDLGRFIAVRTTGLQWLSRECRGALAQKYYWDVDIRNAQPTLLQQYAEKRGWKCDKLKHYNANRDDYLAELMETLQINRDLAKKRVSALMFGGGAVGMSPFFVDELGPELGFLMRNIFTENQHKYPTIVKKPNATRSMMAMVLQTEERACLMAMDVSLAKQGRSLDVLIHDGGLVRKKDGETKFPEEVLRRIEQDVKDLLEYEISLAVKPLTTTFVRNDDEGEMLPNDVLVDDAYAAKTFVSLMEGKIVLAECVWIFDDTIGIWTSDEVVLNRKMVEFGEKLVFRQLGPIGMKVFNYSGDVAHQDRLRRALPSVLPDRKDFFTDRLETSVDKLLFADGIYDFKTSTFTKGFDPEVVFFGAVPRAFPVERNEEAIELVRTKFFRDPFKNPAVGDVLLHFLARGIAGHYEAKKAVIAYGPENSTKGSVTKQLVTTFGGGLMGSFQGDSLLMRTGDVEATKSLSWVKKFCDKRIAVSSEISVSNEKPRPINGALLKSLSGGGDPIVLRTNHKDEETVVNKAITFVFVNDLPPIAPCDGSIRDRLVTIPYSYSFVDEPKFAYQKKRDHTISATLKTDAYRDATVWLILDAMKSWDRQPYPLPEECRALKDDIAPLANVEELLGEEYELTGNPEDAIPTEELVNYLRSRKVDGSDRKIGDKLTQIGLETTVRREGRRTVRVRVGIRRADL
jgi:hypothetical protein